MPFARTPSLADPEPLTVIVVRKESGKPGDGLTTSSNFDADRERVYAERWHRRLPVLPQDF